MKPEYTVIWKRSVIERTIASAVAARMESGQPATDIVRAMTEIDRLLSTSPESAGESRGEEQRVLIVRPLAVTYEVYHDERVVFIRSVWFRSPRDLS